MGIVIPFDRGREPLPSKKRRSSESILQDYAHTMIAVRSICLEGEWFDRACFSTGDVVLVIDPYLGMTDSQEQRLARNVKAIYDFACFSPKLMAIRDVWRLCDEEAPPPSLKAIIAAFKLAGARNERGIAKLVEDAKRDRVAHIEAMKSD
jgi:hypothetical protein